ncbi:competence/damage-inducible protein CinA domain protein [Oleiphilus messinensis]|uniref:Competence/damage-inducible protein CinA domain protein n=1 Tax=Oleiphilus messinensis TaxID=141451 RepID=A0A1Y0I6E7_9GAMM|nr:nicotinamide-nucleotide amidohydrolase family protein [Oleiphilus messinensis]ARU56062.1 competence/damage-inducible protein CinA domain protein [Oleiphilus messinensis]
MNDVEKWLEAIEITPSDADIRALVAVVAQALLDRKMMMASAESCSGGWIGKAATDLAGSSNWYEGGVVSYSNAVKQKLLNVSSESLERFGAVSREVVAQMADGVLNCIPVNLSVAVSGIAGPGGGTADKPVGLVWFGWSSDFGQGMTLCCQFSGDRDTIRRFSVYKAYQGLLELLLQV